MKRALFIVDDRPEAGRGHVVRSGALAAELERRGHRTATIGVVEWATTDSWADNSLPDVCVSDLRSDLPDVERNQWDVVIADGPIGEVGSPGLIVNGGAGVYSEMYRDSGARKVLAGPQYALLRPEFSMTQWPLNSDQLWLDVRSFEGVPARNMACYMASAKVLITAAGMRAMEAACVGAPMVLFVESEDQRYNAEALQRRCAGIIARDEEHARKLVKELLKDPDWLARMSHAGRSMVDGLGCKRVADAIEEML